MGRDQDGLHNIKQWLMVERIDLQARLKQIEQTLAEITRIESGQG